MTRLAEYRDITSEQKATTTVVATNGKYSLGHVTAGWEPAGSVARWTDGYWFVRFMLDGAVHGRRSDEQTARRLFAEWAQAE